MDLLKSYSITVLVLASSMQWRFDAALSKSSRRPSLDSVALLDWMDQDSWVSITLAQSFELLLMH